MSRFNETSTGTKTVNKAGGEAYTMSPELELVSLLITSFANDKFYESADQQFDRLSKLISANDKLFVAKAGIYARTKFGMRSISHVLASELAKHVSNTPWAKKFYENIIYRPDDMMEILSYHSSKGQKLSGAMKKGFALAFNKFDGYQLAKYRGESKKFKLVDVANLVHPKPVDKNEIAIKQLIDGTLKSTETWESKLTQSGQVAKTDKEKEELKANAWKDLILEKKIGYFALLRNLRNILEQAPDVVDQACEMLTDEKLIKKSLVLPFRFTTALDEISKLSTNKVRNVVVAISKAIEISLSNVPVFDGKTLIALDQSGSMMGRPAQIGSLFAAILYKTNDSDFIVFSNDSNYVTPNPLDSVSSIVNSIGFRNGGTNFSSIFEKANKRYDRIIILSDMQSWMGYYAPTRAFSSYKNITGADPHIYSFDLNGYGSMQFPERNVYSIAGFSDKVFDIMKLLESDKNALINEIKKIEI